MKTDARQAEAGEQGQYKYRRRVGHMAEPDDECQLNGKLSEFDRMAIEGK